MQSGIDDRIIELVDKHFQRLYSLGLMKHPVVPPAMAAGTEDEEGWISWKTVPSKVTKDEIAQLESEIGYKLPKLFNDLLRYKYYLELDFGWIRFFPFPSDQGIHAVKNWLVSKSQQYGLLRRGHMIFASSSDDEAYYCFSITKNELSKDAIEQDYPVIFWDPTKAAEKIGTEVFPSFSAMIESLLVDINSD